MATGGGPGSKSRRIGGAHVVLTVDDRAYWPALQRANVRLQQFATSARQAMGGPTYAPMVAGIQKVIDQTRDLGRVANAVAGSFRAINRTILSATVNARALQNAMGGVSRSASISSVSQAARAVAQGDRDARADLRAQADQDRLFWRNLMSDTRARLAAEKAALRAFGPRTAPFKPSAFPAYTATPAIPTGIGDVVAGGGANVLRGLATRIRAAGQLSSALGNQWIHNWTGIHNSLLTAGGGGGIIRGAVASIRRANRGLAGMFSGIETWSYEINRSILGFDFRGGVTGKIAGLFERLRFFDTQMAQKIGSYIPALAQIVRTQSSVGRYFEQIGHTFRAISNRVTGPWQALAAATGRVGNAIGRGGGHVNTFLERVAIALRSVGMRMPNPYQAMARGAAAIGIAGNALGVQIHVTSLKLAAWVRSVSHRVAGLAPGLNAAGGMIGRGAGAVAGALPGAVAGVAGATANVFGALTSGALKFGGVFIKVMAAPFQFAMGAAKSLFGWLGANAAKLAVLFGGIGTALSIKYVIDQVRTMESTLVRLRRTAGTTVAETMEMARSFNIMGTTLAGVDLKHIYELSIMGSRLGVPREQLSLFTRDLAKTSAVLEDIPIEEVAQRVSGLIDVFQLAHVDTIRVASALNALDIASNASGRDILDITGRLSGMASTLGLTVQQTLALATSMRQARVPIETAGTAMSQILGRMVGKDMPAFARVAGMTAKSFESLASKDALGAFVKVEEGLGRLGRIERIRALDALKLDGQRVRLVMLQMIPLLPKLTEYLKLANDEWGSTNSILSGFRMQAETANAMFVRMWNNVQLTAVSLGTFFLPVLKGAADGVGNLASDIRSFVEGNGKGLKAWGESVGKVFLGLGAVTRVNPGDFWAVIKAGSRDLWGQFKSNAAVAFSNVLQIGKNAFTNLGAHLGKVISGILPAIMDAIILSMARTVTRVMAILPAAMKKIMGIPANIGAQIGKLAGGNLFPDPVPMMQGVQKMPGFGMPDVLKMIPGMFQKGNADQLRKRNQKTALGRVQDWVARAIGGVRGKPADAGLGRMAGLAAMEDQGGAGVGGGGGIGPDGAGGGLGAPMAAGGAGRPPGGRRGGPGALDLALMGLGLGGFQSNARARHMELEAWRGRMRQKNPRAVNPFAANLRALQARRQAIWQGLGGGRIAGRRNRRLDLLRRHEARGEANIEGRRAFRVPQIEDWRRRTGIPVNWLGKLPDPALRAGQMAKEAAGIRTWQETAVGEVVEKMGQMTDLMEAFLRRAGIVTFDNP